MPSWFSDFFKVASMYNIGQQIWNGYMGIVSSLMGADTLESFNPVAWLFVSRAVYPWMVSAALVLMNMFFMIGFVRQSTNLRENITIESWIELIIKVIIANALIVNGISLMQSFFSVAAEMKNLFFKDGTSINVMPNDVDAGMVFSQISFGVLYIIICTISGLIVLVEVFSRFLNLYMLVCAAPIALSTIAGGREFEGTAKSWFKSFLTNVFQIVVIALILKIGGFMITGWGFADSTNSPLDWFDGANSVLASMAQITIIATAVKGSDAFLKRVFDLK